MIDDETKFEWTRVNSDGNGNPRYVAHFLNFVEDLSGLGGSGLYEVAVKRANEMGGRRFHNKQYGGGIVFQSYNLLDTERFIRKTLDAIVEREGARI